LKQRYLLGVLAVSALSASVRAETKCKVGQIAQLPVTMAGFRPIVHVQINDKDAAFTADSGAWYSMISPGSAAELGLKLSDLPPGYYNRGIGGSFVPRLTVVDRFTIAGVPIPRVQFLVGGSEVGSVGLLGQNLLALADTEFDLANGMIKLMRSRGCDKVNLAYWAPVGTNYSLLKTEVMPAERPHIVASIYINGVRLRALFDTGASTSFLSLRAAERIGLKPDTPGVTPAGMSGGLGRGFVRTWIGPVASIKIGDEETRNTRLRFGGDDFTDIDMLIGADFFLSHHVYWSNSLHKMFFTFNGGHVFDLRYLQQPAAPSERADEKGEGKVDAAATDGTPQPTDAAGFSRRGAARSARGDVPGAFADYEQAIRLAPENIDYLRQRAILYLRAGQPLRAVDDIDRLLKLKPTDVDALMMRAQMRLRLDRKADVQSDLDAAAAAAPRPSDRRLDLAVLYEATEQYSKAIAQYDLWIEGHPDDNRRPIALNGRCWARAMANVDLDRALKDCNGALSRMPHNPAFLDSRGMARLRMGDYPRALADYDEALKAGSETAWTHFGRGIAELRSGRKSEGEADIAKARSLNPEIAEQGKTHGIVP